MNKLNNENNLDNNKSIVEDDLNFAIKLSKLRESRPRKSFKLTRDRKRNLILFLFELNFVEKRGVSEKRFFLL
jgi:hypothetical protein